MTIVLILVGGWIRDSAWVVWVGFLGVGVLDVVRSLTRKKTLERSIPAEVFVGETFDLALNLDFSPTGLVGSVNWPEGLRGPSRFEITPTTDGKSTAIVPVDAVRRGRWQIDGLQLLWPSRFGLFEFTPRLALEGEIRVVPNIRLVQSGQITTTVTSALFGSKENRAIGEGSEFHQLREFVQGMDVKSIDWKRSAHRGALVAKDLRAERNHQVIVALDNGYLMREEIGGLPKIDHAITASLATAWAAAIGGDQVGFFSYDTQPRIYSPPEPGKIAFTRIRSQTAELEYVSRDTNHTLAMASLGARTPKRSLIIIFTDFVDTTSAEIMIENIGLLTKKHLVVFVAIRDPEIEGITANPPQTLSNVAQIVAADQALSERRIVLERLSRLGVTIVDAKPGQVTARLISTYLEIKAAEMI